MAIEGQEVGQPTGSISFEKPVLPILHARCSSLSVFGILAARHLGGQAEARTVAYSLLVWESLLLYPLVRAEPYALLVASLDQP